MKRTVKEVAELSGISVRTLHYYDEIGLFHPSETTQAGYRLYDDKDLEALQHILFFRELGFELKEIQKIMRSPDFDKNKALNNHKQMLVLKRDRLNDLINLVDKNLKGENVMSFEEFDMSEIEQAQRKYAEEAEQRWGATEEHKQSAKRAKNYDKQDWAKITAEMDNIYQGFIKSMDKGPQSEEAQSFVEAWKQTISNYFYDCSNEILAGLGEMYVADERFTKNIDKHKQGLAAFMSEAIKIYCAKPE